MGRYKRERAIHISRNAPVTRELAVINGGNLPRDHAISDIEFSG